MCTRRTETYPPLGFRGTGHSAPSCHPGRRPRLHKCHPELQIGDNWRGPRGIWHGLRDLAGRFALRDFAPVVLALILTRPRSACPHSHHAHRSVSLCAILWGFRRALCNSMSAQVRLRPRWGSIAKVEGGHLALRDSAWSSCPARFRLATLVAPNLAGPQASGAARENRAPCQFSPI